MSVSVWTVVAALFWSGVALAGSEGTIEINQMDPNADLGVFQDDYKTNSYESLKNQPRMLPTIEVRDRYFRRSGVEEFVKDWDQLDRDRLFMTVSERGSKVVKRYYPAIPPKALERLESLIQSEKLKKLNK